MRPIIFRAWDEKKKKMFYFDLDDYVCDQDGEYGDFDIDIKKQPIMQYTGLKDFNNKEIYESDIIKCDNKIGEVKYDEQQGAYIILWQPHNKKQKSGCDDLASTFPSPLKEIIGNIYENKELLCPSPKKI